jgi:hypothetical protein
MRKLKKQMHGRKKNWLEDLEWKLSERALNQVSYFQRTGKRDPGRLKGRWLDV